VANTLQLLPRASFLCLQSHAYVACFTPSAYLLIIFVQLVLLLAPSLRSCCIAFLPRELLQRAAWGARDQIWAAYTNTATWLDTLAATVCADMLGTLQAVHAIMFPELPPPPPVQPPSVRVCAI
jgi:hypothetical protein